MLARDSTCVANRVQQIINYHTLLGNWRYMETEQIPADIASRGLIAHESQDSMLWWNGPDFLTITELPQSLENVELPPEGPEVKEMSACSADVDVVSQASL